MYDAAPLAVNTAWFETLPEEYQTILFEEADKAREVDLQENDESKYLELLKEAGMEINEVDKEAFQEQCQASGKSLLPSTRTDSIG